MMPYRMLPQNEEHLVLLLRLSSLSTTGPSNSSSSLSPALNTLRISEEGAGSWLVGAKDSKVSEKRPWMIPNTEVRNSAFSSECPELNCDTRLIATRIGGGNASGPRIQGSGRRISQLGTRQ